MMRLYLSDSFKKYTPWFGCLISAFILYHVNATFHIYIDLSSMMLPGFLFYPIGLLGIYFVLSLSSLTELIKPLARLIAFIGKHSFDIMALHFLVFKIIDYMYYHLSGGSPEQLNAFPVGFRSEMGLIYLILGVLIPTFIGWCIDKITKFLLPQTAA